jgi:hypothetical protein
MKPVKSRDDEYTMFGPDGPGTGSALERRQFLKLAATAWPYKRARGAAAIPTTPTPTSRSARTAG